MISRRRFLTTVSAGSTIAMSRSADLLAMASNPAESAKPLVGIQMGPYSIMDEGIDRCLRWVFTTIEDMLANYSFDGLQYGAERTGPLSLLLFRGITPSCFCTYCVARNAKRGIDVQRAKRGFGLLVSLIRDIENGRAKPGDGVVTSVLRIFYRYPEVLSWDHQWFRADEEICSEVHRLAKSYKPAMDSGRHVDHQRSSWDIFYRAATTYGEMADNADFIKPILYHEAMGPRLRWWVLERMKDRVLSELTLEQSLDLFYSLFGQSESEQPSLEQLDSVGLGPEYVYRETRRCKLGVGEKAKVYSGVGIDIPWYAPGGMEPRPSDPEVLQHAVHRALDAGADGVLASREYNEMRISNLEAFGKAVREHKKR